MIIEFIDIAKLTFNNTKSVFIFIIKVKVKIKVTNNLIIYKT